MGDAGLEVGEISLVNNEYLRPKVLSGRPIDILRLDGKRDNRTIYR